jgi:anthranilate phosphoribosyltransferase
VLVEPGRIEFARVDPAELGLGPHPLSTLHGGDAATNAAMLRRTLEGEIGPCRDIVLLNAAAALFAGGKVASLAEGVDAARQAIASGAAKAKLEAYIRFSHGRT